MKKEKNIHNLDSLEREIYRLDLEAKNIEERLDRNLDHLQENYFSMTMNSFFSQKENKKENGNGFWKSFSKNENFRTAISEIGGNIAAKAVESLSDLVDKYLNKKKE